MSTQRFHEAATAGSVEESIGSQGIRWGVSLAVVTLVHLGAAAGVMALKVPPIPADAPEAAVLLELAPIPTAPPPSVEPQPQLEDMLPEIEPLPDPVVEPLVEPEPEPEPEPIPEPVIEPEPEPIPEPPVPAEVALPEKPKPKPPEKPKPEKPKPEKPKPEKPRVEKPRPPPAAQPTQQAETEAPKAAAPSIAPQATKSSAPVSNATPSWQAKVLGHLERHKRYPKMAQMRRQQGVAQVRFTMDRGGKVLSVSLAGSSGHDSLDNETLEMVRRASPLPPPPEGVGGDRAVLELVVPVRFDLR